MSSESVCGTRWLPLESNPDVMNVFVHGLGVPKNFELVDVLGFDVELLEMVPKPVLAVLLLFPTTEKYEAYRQEQEDRLKETNAKPAEGVYFMKQTIPNACGTIGLIHLIGNSQDKIKLSENSQLGRFLERTKDLTPEERGKELEMDKDISTSHSEHALLGQTAAPDPEENVCLHFVSLINCSGHLYELDGRKSVPIDHGTTSDETLLQDAVAVCRQFMERDPDEVRFNLVALTGN